MFDKSQLSDMMMMALPIMGGMRAMTSLNTSGAICFSVRRALTAHAMSAIVRSKRIVVTQSLMAALLYLYPLTIPFQLFLRLLSS